MDSQHVAIVGAGIYGVTAAVELRRRGYAVSLFDPGPLPHPLAASTDISKVVRMDYGPDEDYMALGEQSLDGWRRWNRDWPEPLFHETGVMFVRRTPMAPGQFEYESYQLLLKRGHHPERLVSADIRRRYPAWNADRFVDGYFNAKGGYAESGKVVSRLIEQAQRMGVSLHAGLAFGRLHESGSRVAGIVDAGGKIFPADWVIVAAGSWTPHILPFMADDLRSVGQPVFHVRPDRPDLYRSERFPVFGADISNTGYYGFSLHPDGVVKIANHGTGRRMHPDSPERSVTPEETAAFRDFLRESFPALAEAPIVYTRVCLYCDTWDEHFWIARDPSREGLVVATGGSGHAFKFAPMLGGFIADALEAAPNPLLHKFRWRPEVRPERGEEASRHHE